MTVYIGVDFHARVQTVCWCDLADGEIQVRELHHQEDDIRGFYAPFQGEVIVGVEASGYSTWFEEMLHELGYHVWLGNAREIRRLAKRRQKTDRRDAELILDLLLSDEFPRIYQPSPQSREVLRMLRYRHRLVKMRTMAKNSVPALAISVGLPLKRRLLTKGGREMLLAAPMSPVMSQQREQWLSLLTELDQRIAPLDAWLQEQAHGDPRVERRRTHPGLGLLTSLSLVHTLSPVQRLATSRKVVAYVGLDPMERSSAEKKRYLGISQEGSRLLRFLLVEAARASIKVDPELNRFYRRLVYRRGPQKAIVAVARQLLIRAYIRLRDEIDYAEFLRRGVEARSARSVHRQQA